MNIALDIGVRGGAYPIVLHIYVVKNLVTGSCTASAAYKTRLASIAVQLLSTAQHNLLELGEREQQQFCPVSQTYKKKWAVLTQSK